jgi:hypothetical protein
MGEAVQAEWRSADGLFSSDLLLLNTTSANGCRVVVEVDGPHHFTCGPVPGLDSFWSDTPSEKRRHSNAS